MAPGSTDPMSAAVTTTKAISAKPNKFQIHQAGRPGVEVRITKAPDAATTISPQPAGMANAPGSQPRI